MDRPHFTITYHSQEAPTRYLVLIAVVYDMSEKLYFLTGYSLDPFLGVNGLDGNHLPPLSLSKAAVRAVRGNHESPRLKLTGCIFTAVESFYLSTQELLQTKYINDSYFNICQSKDNSSSMLPL